MLLLSLILVPLFGTLMIFIFYIDTDYKTNENTLKISACFQRCCIKYSNQVLVLLLILVVLLNNFFAYNNSVYSSFAIYNWEIISLALNIICFSLNIANDIICFFIYWIVLIISINFIFIILPYFIIYIIFISFINQKRLEASTVLSVTSSCNDLAQPSISYLKLNLIFFKFIASGGSLILSDLALVLIYSITYIIYLITYISNQIIVKRNEIISFTGHPVMPQMRACVGSFRILEALLLLFLFLYLIQKAFSLISGAEGPFLGIYFFSPLKLFVLIFEVCILSGYSAKYYNSYLSKINWKDEWDPILLSSKESPNYWPLYTSGSLVNLTFVILYLHSFTGALILICALLICVVYSMWSWLRYHASWCYNDIASNVYYNITGLTILCKHLIINLIYLFLVGSCIIIYEIFNKTFLLKKWGYIYRVYYSALSNGNSEKSAAVFVMVIYLIFRLDIFLDYYVFMNNEGSSVNQGNSDQPSGNNGNNNGPNNYHTSASTDENNRKNSNIMNLSFMLSNDTTSSVSSSTNIVQNQNNNIRTTREVDITNHTFNITGSSTQEVETSSVSNLALSAYPSISTFNITRANNIQGTFLHIDHYTGACCIRLNSYAKTNDVEAVSKLNAFKRGTLSDCEIKILDIITHKNFQHKPVLVLGNVGQSHDIVCGISGVIIPFFNTYRDKMGTPQNLDMGEDRIFLPNSSCMAKESSRNRYVGNDILFNGNMITTGSRDQNLIRSDSTGNTRLHDELNHLFNITNSTFPNVSTQISTSSAQNIVQPITSRPYWGNSVTQSFTAYTGLPTTSVNISTSTAERALAVPIRGLFVHRFHPTEGSCIGLKSYHRDYVLQSSISLNAFKRGPLANCEIQRLRFPDQSGIKQCTPLVPVLVLGNVEKWYGEIYSQGGIIIRDISRDGDEIATPYPTKLCGGFMHFPDAKPKTR